MRNVRSREGEAKARDTGDEDVRMLASKPCCSVANAMHVHKIPLGQPSLS
jgi:hypothetical protein